MTTQIDVYHIPDTRADARHAPAVTLSAKSSVSSIANI
jgi:hypothetical protein